MINFCLQSEVKMRRMMERMLCMKKTVALILASFLMLTFISCQPAGENEESSLTESSSVESSSEKENETNSEEKSEATSEEKSEVSSEEKSEETAEISSSVLEQSSIPLPEKSSVSNQISSKPVSQAPETSSGKNDKPVAGKVDESVESLMAMPDLTKPILTGDFIQSGMYTNWDQARWEKHFNELKAVGITSVILQQGARNNKGLVYRVDYKHCIPDHLLDPSVKENTHILGIVLEAAKATGCTVWIGLGIADDWWTESNHWDEEWRDTQCEINRYVIKSLVDNYYKDYKNQIAGFYWANETYTNSWGLEDFWAEMLSTDLDYLTSLKVDIPMMIAPYNSEFYITGRLNGSPDDGYKLKISPEKTEKIWKRFISLTSFRDGDVFCPMDGLYTMYIDIDDAIDYLVAMKNAVDSCEADLQFWMDVETFTQSFGSAPMERYTQQLQLSAKLATGLVGFSYSHYYSTAGRQNASSLREEYAEYVKDYLD